MDLGIVVGYVSAYLLGGTKRFADRTLDRLLDRLYVRVKAGLADRESLAHLEEQPASTAAQHWVRQELEQAVARDAALGAELAKIQRDVQRRAPDLLVHASRGDTVVGVNSGYVVTRARTVNIHHRSQGRAAQDLSDAPPAVKAALGTGIALMVLAICLFWAESLLVDSPGPGDPDFAVGPTPFTKVTMVMAVVGFALAMVTAIVHSLRGSPGSNRPRGR